MHEGTGLAQNTATSGQASAVLYTYSESIWSSVALLAVYELGLENLIQNQTVDIDRGEQYTLSYLKLNPAGTVPTLVIPAGSLLARQHGLQVVRDSGAITELLRMSTRTSNSVTEPSQESSTTQAISDRIISSLRDQAGPDPRFLKRSPRNSQEFQQVAENLAHVHRLRQEALERTLAELQTEDSITQSEILPVVQDKLDKNRKLIKLWANDNPVQTEQRMASATRLWSVLLPAAFEELERSMVGPYCCGSEITVADFNLAAWLARVIHASGGTAEGDAFVRLENKIGIGYKAGAKIRAFWDAIKQRPSFKHVYARGLH